MTELNAAALIDDVRTLAAENPDNKAICAYVTRVVDGKDDGTLRPECIMGHALVRAGVDISLLDVATSIRSILYGPRFWAGDDFTSVYTYNQVSWLNYVQARQDGGATWADAVKYADQEVPL